MPNAIPTPDWATERINALGGLNRYGKPNWMIVWGGSRTQKVGGVFKDVINGLVYDVPEVRELLKYHPERWHLERWIAPEKYGTCEQWYESTWDSVANLHTCGDYPAEGDYEHVFYLAQCPHMYADESAFLAQHPLPNTSVFIHGYDYAKAVSEWQEERAKGGIGEWCNYCKLACGEYIPLDGNFHLFELQVNLFKLSENVTEREQREALFDREFEKRKESRNRAATITKNRMMAFGTVPHSYVSDSNRRCSVPDAKFNPRLYQPLGKSKFQQIKEEKAKVTLT